MNNMTTFGDLVYQLGGVPVAQGLPLQINTKYWFVDGANGSDGNDGESAATPLATIAAAITKMNGRIDWSATPWAKRDVLIIAPGTYAENLTSLPHGCTVYGLGHDLRDAQNGVKIKPATGAAVDVSAVINTAFYNIHFETAETDAGDRAFDAAICNNCLFYNCRFSGPAETATAVGFYTNNATGNKFILCEFDCCDVGFDAAYVDANDGFNHNWLYECRFTQCDTAGLRMSTNLVGPSSIVERCVFVGAGQTMAIGIDDNAGILDLVQCHITATDPVQGCRSANGCYGNGSLLDGSGD
jgi:hypothetical protein